MNERAPVEEIEALLAASPTDHALRRDLIDMLLSRRELDQASRHFDALIEQLPNETWVVQFGIEVMAVTGDTLMAARLKKRLRDLEDSDDDDLPGPHPGHPSQDKVSQRHLSLVQAGSDNGERHDGVGFQTHLRLHDIAGLAAVKRNLQQLIADVRAPVRSASGWRGGRLLYGPPSCGKAFCGEVIAGELGSTFWYLDLSDRWDKDDIEEAIASATEQGSIDAPSVLYLDNIDVLAPERAEPLVPPLDDAVFQNTIIPLCAATYPWKVSNRLVSTSRIGEVLLVLPPDAPARRTFIEHRTAGRAAITPVDLDWVADHTEGHSFEDLDRLIDLAFLIDEGPEGELSHKALRAARQKINSSSSEWLTVAGHHALMNEEGGLYDDLIAYFHARQK